MKNNNFEKSIPPGHVIVKHLDAKNVKLDLLLNVIAMLIFVCIAVLALIPVFKSNGKFDFFSDIGQLVKIMLYSSVFLILILFYMILHELTHGAFYKVLTGEPLTFGISWSCAFCGVPNIYVYRKSALLAAAAPLVIFTVILLPLTAFLYFINITAYILSAFLFGMHLGGCAGDIYVVFLLLFKYKNNKTLIRDTGPEQFFYIPENPD